MSSDFFAYLNRAKYIERWSLMRNTRKENILEHSAQTAQLAYFLALIKNNLYGGNVDQNLVVSIAIFHEIPEVLTGDLPTPIKYFDEDIKTAYKNIENLATEKLTNLLPNELKGDFNKVVNIDKNSYEYIIVKMADKLAAYIKCLEEINAGNDEFKVAKQNIEVLLIESMDEHPELKYFFENFIQSYSKTLDELLNK